MGAIPFVFLRNLRYLGQPRGYPLIAAHLRAATEGLDDIAGEVIKLNKE
jgi:hypothetical protein